MNKLRELTIHTGNGGLEARDWSLILASMYLRWAMVNNLEASIQSFDGGFKVNIACGGDLSSECGVHRFVRISPFDIEHCRHTTFALVSNGNQADWGNQIRSYVLHPYKMVKDHRTNYETDDIEGVLNGGLDNFIIT